MALDWGMVAGGAQDALQQLLEQRILQEEMALAQRRQAAEEAHRAAMLEEQRAGRLQQGGQFDKTFGLDTERFQKVEVPTADVSNQLTRVRTGNEQQEGLFKATEHADKTFAQEELLGDPNMRPVILGLRAGGAAPPANDMTGNIARTFIAGENAKDRVARLAAGASSGPASGFVDTWMVDGLRDGKPGKIRKGQRPDGTVVDIDFEGAGPTAEQTNRQQFKTDFKPIVDAFAELSDSINTGSGISQWLKGKGRSVMASFGADDPVALMNSMLPMMGMTAARVFGSNSQLSDGERKSAMEFLVSAPNSGRLARVKIALMQGVMNAGTDEEEAAAVRTFLAEVAGGMQQPGAAPKVGEKRSF